MPISVSGPAVPFGGRITVRGSHLGHVQKELMTRLRADGIHFRDVSLPPHDEKALRASSVFHMVLATHGDLKFFNALKVIETVAAKYTIAGLLDQGSEIALVSGYRKLHELFYKREPVIDLGERNHLSDDEYARIRTELQKELTDPESDWHEHHREPRA